jgi:hypothetical protein
MAARPATRRAVRRAAAALDAAVVPDERQHLAAHLVVLPLQKNRLRIRQRIWCEADERWSFTSANTWQGSVPSPLQQTRTEFISTGAKRTTGGAKRQMHPSASTWSGRAVVSRMPPASPTERNTATAAGV